MEFGVFGKTSGHPVTFHVKVCMCVCVYVRACVRVYMRTCVCVCVGEREKEIRIIKMKTRMYISNCDKGYMFYCSFCYAQSLLCYYFRTKHDGDFSSNHESININNGSCTSH